ncbi:MAG TPA: hypothetical protein VF319_00470 [Caldimonas sp.]
MPTIRGFVERLEVGRAGLVTASVLHDDASFADYLISDLDADPERFNERLSKLGLLRDAMSRAEPVEIEYTQVESGTRTIDRVGRITRDVLAGNGATQRVPVFIVGVGVLADNRTGSRAEAGDRATVATLSASGALASFTLELQAPERAVAIALLEMIRAAQASGEPVTLTVDAKNQRIVGVEAGDASASLQPGDNETVDGFVEAVIVAPGLAPMGNLALIEFTTAPPFSGAGNVVELNPFLPVLRRFLVVQGSLEYELFVAGLRDKLRMRVMCGAQVGRTGGSDRPTGTNDGNADTPRVLGAGFLAAGAAASDGGAGSDATVTPAEWTLVRGTQLLAALASASRPVWIQISRHSLDVGPDGDKCTEGLPSSDLSPQSLRDLHIPYTAEWIGCGCFNHGVYRLQFELAVDFEVSVDGRPLCVHASEDGKTKFAHACLHDEHVIRVVLQRWTCKQVFRMDVYRIR